MTLAIAGNSASGYNLTKSLRFRSSASAYLNRTPASATNRTTWTWSAWVKLGSVSANECLFGSGTTVNSGNGVTEIGFQTDNSMAFTVWQYLSGVQWRITTSAIQRDPSAWYHFVVAVDTTQATSSNRVKIYINGVQQTSLYYSSYPTQNYNTGIDSTDAHNIGRRPDGSNYFDGYQAEVNFIDGQALTASSFGSTNALTGVWQPAQYTGTYGTNGFYLPFTDVATTSGSNAGLGKDFSGNGNYWNTNNISVTSGSTYDSMTDVPTLTSSTVANYCVVNPLDSYGGTSYVANGNLQFYTASNINGGASSRATLGMSSGKWYWEATAVSVSSNRPYFGVGIDAYGTNVWAINPAGVTGNYTYNVDGSKGVNGTGSAYGASIATNDVVGVAFDADAGTLTFYKNGVSQGVAATATTGVTYAPYQSMYVDAASSTHASGWNLNFGQQPFAYTPPTGFVALNTYNLPTSTIVQGNTVMDATLYTGNGTTQSITNTAGFYPDFTWIKSRSSARKNNLYDSIRGVGKELYSNNTDAETTAPDSLTAFNSNGFSLGNDGGSNANAATFVGWQWNAGSGTTSSNTNGSITSTVSVNPTAGFSIVTYTNVASGVQTVGHGLGVAPSMIIVKFRSAISDWGVYSSAYGNTGALKLNTTGTPDVNISWWNNTSPTSSVFTLGTQWNGTQTAVAYCWAEVAGFSKFGSYTGNGSTDGPFIYTGFRPKFVIARVIDQASFWNLFDSARDPYNVTDHYLYPNSSNAEGSGGNDKMDFLSNGFKIRGTGAGVNSNGSPAIYMAFAENPFKNALAR